MTRGATRTVPYVCAGIVASGFVAIGLSWRGAAALLAVPLQIPFAISGGAGGLALIVFGVGIAYVHMLRIAAATESEAIDDLDRRLARVGAAVVLDQRTARQARRARRAARRMYRTEQST